MSHTFTEYLYALMRPAPCETSDAEKKQLAVAVLIVATAINLFSMKVAKAVTDIFWYAKIIAISIIVFVGINNLCLGYTDNVANAFEGTSTDFSAYSIAIYSGMWSFDGWHVLSYITEELKNPVRNYPIAVFVVLPLIGLIYILANLAYLTVLTPNEIKTDSSIAITFAYRTLGSFGWIIPVGIACSTFGTMTANLLTTSRLCNAGSRRSHLPKVLSYIDTERYTPSLALLFSSGISILYLIPEASNFNSILDFFSFTTWLFYGSACLAVIVLRYKSAYKDKPRPYKVWLPLPIISTIGSYYLVVAPLVSSFSLGHILVMVLLVGMGIFYVPIHVFRVTWFDAPMNWITLHLQKILQLAPAEVEFD